MIITAAELDECRRDQESTMTATCTVHEKGDGYVLVDHREVPALGDQVYPTGDAPGICLPQALQSNASGEQRAGEQNVTVRPYAVKLPWTATGIRPDHVVTITGSHDPDLIGKRLVVVDVPGNEVTTCRRLICIDNLG